MRKIFALLLGLSMVMSALWLAYQEFFVSDQLSLRLVAATAFLLFIGGYILWAGVISSSPKRGDQEK